MTSEETKKALRGNMHLDTWVIGVADFKFEANWGHGGRLETAMASESTKMAVAGNVHMDMYYKGNRG